MQSSTSISARACVRALVCVRAWVRALLYMRASPQSRGARTRKRCWQPGFVQPVEEVEHRLGEVDGAAARRRVLAAQRPKAGRAHRYKGS
eukprot:5959654-Pleurochrysis_carterae.AAC.2